MKTIKKFKFIKLLLVSSILLSCSDDDAVQSTDNSEETSSARLFTSNNANGNITIYDVSNMADIKSKTLVTTSLKADGIYYDSSSDIAVQASRDGSIALEGFANISSSVSGAAISKTIIGTSDMESPREVAVSGNFYVVADNSDVDGDDSTADGRFFIYEKADNKFMLRNTITTNFKVWGITFIDADLYAIVDTTNKLAMFKDFLSNTTDATVMATKTIAVEGIVRTHGITYDVSSNMMILTDIGDAASGTDGGFHMISSFKSKFSAVADGGTLALTDQIRVAGSNTNLGNPVDVAYDSKTETVFIAEAKNGKILAFNSISNGGNLEPAISNSLESASAVYFQRK